HDGPTDEDGRALGFLGMVRMITGADALGGGLTSCGYSVCADIPSSGSCSMTEDIGTFAMTFGTPTKVIPTGHTGADGSTKYQKKVSVAINGTSFMIFEFNCSATIGWMRFTDPDASSGGSTATSRHIEMYYDTNTAASTKFEMGMYYNPAGGITDEYFQVKFQTDTSSTFDLWLTRSAEQAGVKQGFRVGMRGNSSTKQASVFMFFQDLDWTNASTAHTDNNNIAATGDIMCVDYLGTPTAVDGSCAGLSINAPGALLINSGGDMSINSTVVDLIGSMTAL
ncbi:MAG: hypothetical protein AABY86_14690, partial [Bdellovibrionota bacterium]